MDYQKVYNQIIERAKERILEGYKEKHHIVPKCLGGSNVPENLVDLTAREHYVCHWLLTRIYPESSQLGTAFWFMSWQKSKGQERYHKITSRAYAEAVSCLRFTEEHKRKIGDKRKGKKTLVHPETHEIKYIPQEEAQTWIDAGWENTNYKRGMKIQLKPEAKASMSAYRKKVQTGKVGLDSMAAKGPYTVIYEDGTRVTRGSYPELVKATGIKYSTLQWKSTKSPGKFSKGFAVIKGE